jgi:hypothetical protein
MTEPEIPNIEPVVIDETPQEEKPFKLEIATEELRKRSLFVATPMYGGQCSGMFARSIADLSALCQHYGIPLQLYFLFNESLITRARNYCCDEFLRSKASHLMFIDSDIGFDPRDVIALLGMQSEESDYDIIGGAYPKKTISWEKVKTAVDKGFADDDPNVLEKFVGDYVFNPKGNQGFIPLNRPVELLEIGTGFMMIRRKTLETFANAFPEYSYRPDHVRTEAFDGSREIMQFFQAEIVEKRYLSEDYWFCQKVQELNLKTWLCPWMRLQHAGTYVFGGSLADIAAVGASATADAAELEKTKNRGQQFKKPEKKRG